MCRTIVRTAVIWFCISWFSLAWAADPVATWPQWRGPSRDGRIEGPAWPDRVDEQRLRQSWRVELGPSYSGPIVAVDRVFVAETRDKSHEVVRALDRRTGRELWKTDWAGALSVPFFAAANGSWIRATPALDGDRLYVAGMRDVLVCLDTATGKEIWRVDFVAELKSQLPTFGFVSSPLVDGGHIYVQAGGGFIKLDKLTGKIVWRALDDGGGMMGSAFSSPVIATLAGKRQAIVQTRLKLAGVALDTGAELWSREIPSFRGMNILTPTMWGDRVFTSSHSGGAFLFSFKATGDKIEVAPVWENKIQAYMSSPIVLGDHAYVHLKNQRLACFDLRTGERPWTSSAYGQYWSMVARGDKILALDERGDLHLVRATPEKFDLLDSRHLGDRPTWAHLAVCDDEVFVRDLAGLSVYRWRDPARQ